MPRFRRICIQQTQHYARFRLVDENAAGEALRGELTRRELRPPLLAWVARARRLSAVNG